MLMSLRYDPPAGRGRSERV